MNQRRESPQNNEVDVVRTAAPVEATRLREIAAFVLRRAPFGDRAYQFRWNWSDCRRRAGGRVRKRNSATASRNGCKQDAAGVAPLAERDRDAALRRLDRKFVRFASLARRSPVASSPGFPGARRQASRVRRGVAILSVMPISTGRRDMSIPPENLDAGSANSPFAISGPAPESPFWSTGSPSTILAQEVRSTSLRFTQSPTRAVGWMM